MSGALETVRDIVILLLLVWAGYWIRQLRKEVKVFKKLSCARVDHARKKVMKP